MFKIPYSILQDLKKKNYIKEENNKFYVTKYFEQLNEDQNHTETKIESDLSMFGKKEFSFEEWKKWDNSK